MRECYSPESRSMNKDSTSFRNSGTYTSPGTPDYADNHGRGFQKGWCSERVPLPSNSNRRRTTANILMPFNNGRTLPSKWDDAERWITSPVSGSGSNVFKSQQPPPPPQRRPKSKSGPLGPTTNDGTTYSSSTYSPGFQFLEGGTTNNVFASSPFSTGVLVPNGYSFHHTGENIDENKVTSAAVSRRDMATQMSPGDSPESTSPPPVPSPVKDRRQHVRDVQVDKRVTMTKQPKRKEKNRSTEINDLALTWNPTAGSMELSKFQKEEARIVAWENLQNAKAEASIRKLEMKLEKKKSASMEKIIKKLTVAQMKAQEMREKMSANEASTTSRKVKIMSLHRYPKISLTCCFFVH
ncbi:hypothetical protein LXL04_013528 [Taraxacum kok-saghyz]